LQHGQKINGVVEKILQQSGIKLMPVNDAHICCGSAGTYSILQPELSQQLLENKLQALQINKPEVIATANVGCQMHLASSAGIPVVHWIELLDG
jgi:glycolate oxidase iron-sulfur subunit